MDEAEVRWQMVLQLTPGGVQVRARLHWAGLGWAGLGLADFALLAELSKGCTVLGRDAALC